MSEMYFSNNKIVLYHEINTISRGCSIRKVLLKFAQDLQEINCGGVSFSKQSTAIRIKQIAGHANFIFQHVLPCIPDDTYQMIKELNRNEATTGNTPPPPNPQAKVLKTPTKDIYILRRYNSN